MGHKNRYKDNTYSAVNTYKYLIYILYISHVFYYVPSIRLMQLGTKAKAAMIVIYLTVLTHTIVIVHAMCYPKHYSPSYSANDLVVYVPKSKRRTTRYQQVKALLVKTVQKVCTMAYNYTTEVRTRRSNQRLIAHTMTTARRYHCSPTRYRLLAMSVLAMQAKGLTECADSTLTQER